MAIKLLVLVMNIVTQLYHFAHLIRLLTNHSTNQILWRLIWT